MASRKAQVVPICLVDLAELGLRARSESSREHTRVPLISHSTSSMFQEFECTEDSKGPLGGGFCCSRLGRCRVAVMARLNEKLLEI